MKRFVLSDSHGGYKAIMQCLERCGFNQEQDQLFFIGDVVDGWSETKESIKLLLSIPNLIYLLGNHDQWAMKCYTGILFKSDPANQLELEAWITQGGAATVKSYGLEKGMPPKHLKFLQNAYSYYVTQDNILLVHAGFAPETPIEKTNIEYLIWSRNFVQKHYQNYRKSQRSLLPKADLNVSVYKEVYLGHTPTISFDAKPTLPLIMGNVILMDTGAAFTGRLSVMDIDTKEVWQSDPVMQLYPDEPGRNGVSWNAVQEE